MKVSLITTVYNVEEWLERNIQAFLKQTLKDSELILVNDCSPDTSKDIISKYNDSRIKVINNEVNVGAGVSRQIGVDNSCGEYTIFVDGDDWLEEDCLEQMYNCAIDNNSDIVSCNVIHHNEYGCVKYVQQGSTVIKEDFYNFINNKLIKREIWNKVKYSPLRLHEDIGTLHRCLSVSKKCININYAGYNYNLRPNSLTTSKDVVKSLLYSALAIIENLEWRKTVTEVCNEFNSRYNLDNLFVNIFLAQELGVGKEYSEELLFIKDYLETNNVSSSKNFLNTPIKTSK